MAGRAGDDDGVVGPGLGPAEVPVSVPCPHPVIALAAQQAPGPFQQGFDDLHRVHVGCKVGQHGGLVARSGPDLKHLRSRIQFEEFGHIGHDVGLGDSLAESDEKRCVFVGQAPGLFVDEHVAGRFPHGFEYGRVRHPGRLVQDHLDHARPLVPPLAGGTGTRRRPGRVRHYRPDRPGGGLAVNGCGRHPRSGGRVIRLRRRRRIRPGGTGEIHRAAYQYEAARQNGKNEKVNGWHGASNTDSGLGTGPAGRIITPKPAVCRTAAGWSGVRNPACAGPCLWNTCPAAGSCPC